MSSRDISFGIGQKSKTRIDHELFEDPAWELSPLRELKQTAAAQLGTVGGGNHYVDIFADEADRIWVGVHFGSRGLGHKTATHFLKAAGGKDGMDVPPTVVSEASPLGEDYIAAMTLAGRYAYAGREAVARHVVRGILRANALEEVHNHHNFAWREEHDGQQYWVVRKGATPAFPGQKGFVGGSMGDDAVIIEGRRFAGFARGAFLDRARRRPDHVAHGGEGKIRQGGRQTDPHRKALSGMMK